MACKIVDIQPHPARFPRGIPSFFIKFLTDKNDLILDPFAGSNVTGQVAEQLNRTWVAIELVEEYLQGSKLRFPNLAETKQILLEMEQSKLKAASKKKT